MVEKGSNSLFWEDFCPMMLAFKTNTALAVMHKCNILSN